MPTIVTLGLLTVLAALLASASAVSAQSSAPVTPDHPTGTVVFIGGVDLEWNDVPGADSYDVQLYRNGQWIDLPGDGVEIAFYGAGAIIRELDPTSSLWFQVRARNAHGISDWSDFNYMASTNQYESGRQARPDNVAASGAPVINGTAQVRETLTADTTGIVDANGLDRVEFRFQWVSNDGSADTDITGGTDSTYTLVADDAGKPIKVRVSFTDRGGYAETLTSDATVAATVLANSPATGAPTITGTAQVGETLTADTTVIVDDDGLSGATFSYQWVGNDGNADTDITGATDSSYTLVADDEGKTIKVRVSFTDDAVNDETLTSDATAAVIARPNSPATGAPAITGTAQVGETLTADTSGIADPDGLTNVSYSYQWVSNDGTADRDIAGATDSTYTLVAFDEGKTIRVRVSFTDDAANEESLTSDATAVVAARPNSPATGGPAITGTAQVGETLTADTAGIADNDGLSGVTFSYQWVSNDGTSDTDITGETNSTYTLVATDEGVSIGHTFHDNVPIPERKPKVSLKGTLPPHSQNEYDRIYKRELKKWARENGLCVACKKEPSLENSSPCQKCKDENARRYQAAIDQGVCTSCLQEPPRPNRRMCNCCSSRKRSKERTRRANQNLAASASEITEPLPYHSATADSKETSTTTDPATAQTP